LLVLAIVPPLLSSLFSLPSLISHLPPSSHEPARLPPISRHRRHRRKNSVPPSTHADYTVRSMNPYASDSPYPRLSRRSLSTDRCVIGPTVPYRMKLAASERCFTRSCFATISRHFAHLSPVTIYSRIEDGRRGWDSAGKYVN